MPTPTTIPFTQSAGFNISPVPPILAANEVTLSDFASTPLQIDRRGLPNGSWVNLATATQFVAIPSPFTFVLPRTPNDQLIRVTTGEATFVTGTIDVISSIEITSYTTSVAAGDLINLAWTRTKAASEPDQSFTVFRRGLPGGSFVPVISLPGNVFSTSFVAPAGADQEIIVATEDDASLPVVVDVISGDCAIDLTIVGWGNPAVNPLPAQAGNPITISWTGIFANVEVFRRGLPNGAWVKVSPPGGVGLNEGYQFTFQLPFQTVNQAIQVRSLNGLVLSDVEIVPVTPAIVIQGVTNPVAAGAACTVFFNSIYPAGTTFTVQRRGVPSGSWVSVGTTQTSPFVFNVPNAPTDQEIRVVVGSVISNVVVTDVQ